MSAARDVLLAALLPPCEAGRLPGLGTLDTAGFWSEFSQAAPPLLRFGVRSSVLALTWLPALLIGVPRRFGALSPADQDRFLSAAARSRLYLLRQMVATLKAVACLAYFADAGVRARVLARGGP